MSVKSHLERKSCAAIAVRMNREMRRQQIAKVAARLFAERGFRGTTTKDIAQEAGVSEAALFQHFNSKAELYAEILDDKAKHIYGGDWITEINAYIAKKDDEGLLNAISRRILEYCQKDPDFLRLMLYSALEGHESAKTIRQQMTRPVFELLRDYIVSRQQDGVFRECNSEAAAFAFLGTQIYYVIARYLFNSTMITIAEDEAISNFIQLSLNGLNSNKIARNDNDIFFVQDTK